MMNIFAAVTSFTAVDLNLINDSENFIGGRTPTAEHEMLNSLPIPDLQIKANLYSCKKNQSSSLEI